LPLVIGNTTPRYHEAQPPAAPATSALLPCHPRPPQQFGRHARHPRSRRPGPPSTSRPPGRSARGKIHGTALEGNLEGNDVDRDAIVFLPPGYQAETTRRYQVVYALHGYSIGAEQWSGEIHVRQAIEGAFAQGAKEMIVVLPDSKTLHNGSMYSSSVTMGDFERYSAPEVVAYIAGAFGPSTGEARLPDPAFVRSR
jgi:enterochelin esterase-like enzyme